MDLSSFSPPPVLSSSLLSGLITRVLLHPIDTVKSRLQSPTASAPATLLSDLKSAPARSLYKGLAPSLLGGVPATAIYLTSYTYSQSFLSSHTESRVASSLASGFVAETVACVIYVPVDVLKERMQISTLKGSIPYKSTSECLRSIVRNEGMAGIYRGYGGTLAR